MPAAAKSTTPAAYLAALSEPRRSELKALHAAIRQAAPRLTRPTMARVSVTATTTTFTPVAQYISLYIMGHRNGTTIAEASASQLGKVSVGKVCIRFKKLTELNLLVALERVREASALHDNGSTDFAL